MDPYHNQDASYGIQKVIQQLFSTIEEKDIVLKIMEERCKIKEAELVGPIHTTQKEKNITFE